MPPSFASDDVSHLERVFGPQRYGASFGDPIDIESGAYSFVTTDLSVHARGVNFAFSRTYNSADDWYEPDGSSFLGPGWRHSYWSEITRAPMGGSGCSGTLMRGDGKRSPIVADGTDGDFSGCTFASGITTVTMRDQTRYVFGNRWDYEPGESTVYSLYQLLRIELPTGDRVLLTYAGSPRPGTGYLPVLSTVTDTVGRVYHFTYDVTARLTRVDDPAGRAVVFAYDLGGRLTNATDPAGAVTRYSYDSGRHITTYTDPDGRVRATNTYWYTGAVTQQTDGEGYTTSRSGTQITDPRGTITDYNFCICGIGLTQERVWPNGYGNTPYYDTLYGYDAHDNRNRITDRLGRVTTLTYESRANANLLSTTDAAGGVTSYEYDNKNNPTRITDQRGFTTERTYDPITGVPLTERRQVDATTFATTTYTYGDPANPGLPTAITTPRGSVATLAYDTSGNLITNIDPEGNVTTYVYDALGRQTSVTDPDGHTAVSTYDPDDRVLSITDALGHLARYAYDGSGNKSTAVDRDGNLTTYVYDRNARLVSTQQQPGAGSMYTTNLVRDGIGNVTRVTESNGAIRDTTYDAFDAIMSTTEHAVSGSLSTTYTRDAMGNQASRTTADGVTTTYAYDALYRLTSVTAPAVSITYGYDAAGNRTTISDVTGTTTYAYDGVGRLTSVGTPGATITYAYDLDGNRTTVGYPGAGNVTYVYSPGGHISTVTDWASRQSTYTYRPSGLVASVTYPNGMLATYGYDAAGRLTQLTNAIGPTTITSHTYTLDPEGNRTGLSEFVSGITAPGGSDAIVYTYDGLNRLTGSTGVVNESFTLDGASNVTSRTGPSATYAYDGADRLQSDGTLTYGWSPADRVVFRGPPPPPPPAPPSVTFRAQSTANNGTGTSSITINRPSGTQSGDLLVAFVYINQGGASLNGPAGWSSVGGPTSNGYYQGRVFYRFATASDPASWTWTFGQYYDYEDHVWYSYIGPAIGSILAYSGVDPNAPLSPTTASANSGATATIYANSITTGSANETVLASYGQYSQTAAATPSGWTNRVAASTGYSSGTLKVEEQVVPAAGSAAVAQWTSTTSQWVAFMVGLKPAPPPPPPPPPPGDTFTYDPLGRLTGSTVANTARTYTYNGDGLLQSRTESGTTNPFLWDPASSPSRLLQTGSDRVVYGLGPLYVVKADGTMTALARDGIESVRAEVSQTGAVAASFRYRAYGEILQSSGSTPTVLGFAGELRDSTALVYLRSRWYDPSSARFLTADPLGLANQYGYAAANPVNLKDSSGLIAAPGEDGGACADAACGEYAKPFSDATWDAAAGMLGMTGHLQNLMLKPTPPPPPSDYVATTVSVGVILAVNYTRATDKFGQEYTGLGLGVSLSPLPVNVSVTRANIDIPREAVTPASISNVILGPTVNIGGGVVGGAWKVVSPNGRSASEVGATTPQLGLGGSFGWRSGGLARLMIGGFGNPYDRYR